MAVELAQGYVSLSIGFKGNPTKDIQSFLGGAQAAADKAGQSMGRALSAGVASGVEKAKADVAAAQKALESADKAAKQAAQNQANASRQVQIAEAKLAETRAKYAKDSSQVLSAEDRLERAKQKSAKADLALAAAEDKRSQASDKAQQAVKAQAAAEEQAEKRHRGVLGRMSASLTRLQSKLPNPYADMPDRASASAQQASSTFGAHIVGSTKTVGAKFKTGMSTALSAAAGAAGASAMTALGAATAAGVGVVGVALKKGFGRLESIDNAKNKLIGLGHSAQEVDAIMGDALASVKGTAFGMDEAATTAGMLVASGIKPGKELASTLKTVADTATIAGGSMTDVGDIFASVAARGKLQGDDMLQLMSDGVPVLQALSEHLHISQADVSDMVSAGKIDFATFADAMEKNIGGAAESSGQTFSGSLKNMGAALGRVGENFLSGVFPELAPTFRDITSAMKPLEDGAKKVGKAIGDILGPAFDKLRKALKGDGKGGGIGAAISGLFSGLTGNKGASPKTPSPAAKTPSAAGKVSAVAVPKVPAPTGLTTWWKAGEKLRHTFEDLRAKVGPELSDMASRCGELGSSVKEVFNGAKDVIVSLAREIGPLAGPLALGALKLAWDALKLAVSAASGVLSKVGEFLQRHKDAVTGVVLSIGAAVLAYKATVKAMLIWHKRTLIITAAQKALALAQAALNLVMSANPIALIVAALAGLVVGFVYAYKHSETFRRIVNGAINGVKNAAVAVANWFKGPFVNFFKSAFNAVKNAVTNAKNTVGRVFTTMKDVVLRVARALWGGVKSAFNTGKNAVITVVNNVKNGVVRVWNAIKSTVTKVASAIWSGVKKTFNTMKTGVVNIFNSIKSAVGKVWGGIKSVVGKPIRFVIDTVINKGILGAYNWVAGKVGAKKLGTVAMPKGLKSGGIVPGTFDPAHRDNVLGVTAAGIPVARVEPGEMVINRAATARHAALLHAINDGRLPRYAGGGIIGKAKTFFGNVADELKDVFSDVAGWLKKKIGDPVQKTISAVGNNPAARIVSAAPKKLIDAAVNKLKGILSFGGGESIGDVAIPAGSGVGRWRPMVAAALRISGIGGGTADENLWLKQIVTESGGNPRLVQSSAVYDINIANGDPARGLVQVPGVTWADFGRDMGSFIPNVYNPLKNLIVGMRAAARQHRSWRAVIGKGHGYIDGGTVPFSQIAALSEDGRPELVVGPQMRKLNAGTTVFNADQTSQIMGGPRTQVTITGPVYGDPTDYARAIEQRQREALAMLAYA